MPRIPLQDAKEARTGQYKPAHPDRYLTRVFATCPEAELETITAEIREQCENVQFKPATIERILRKYAAAQHEGRARAPPYVYELEPGVWAYTQHPPDTDPRRPFSSSA